MSWFRKLFTKEDESSGVKVNVTVDVTSPDYMEETHLNKVKRKFKEDSVEQSEWDVALAEFKEKYKDDKYFTVKDETERDYLYTITLNECEYDPKLPVGCIETLHCLTRLHPKNRDISTQKHKSFSWTLRDIEHMYVVVANVDNLYSINTCRNNLLGNYNMLYKHLPLDMVKLFSEKEKECTIVDDYLCREKVEKSFTKGFIKKVKKSILRNIMSKWEGKDIVTKGNIDSEDYTLGSLVFYGGDLHMVANYHNPEEYCNDKDLTELTKVVLFNLCKHNVPDDNSTTVDYKVLQGCDKVTLKY